MQKLDLRAWNKVEGVFYTFNEWEDESSGRIVSIDFDGKQIETCEEDFEGDVIMLKPMSDFVINLFSGIFDMNMKKLYERDLAVVNVEVNEDPYSGQEWIDNDYYVIVSYQPSRGFFGKVVAGIDNLSGEKIPKNELPQTVRLAAYRTKKIGNNYENNDLIENI